MERYIIAFTGAGISKESGIPTFEEQKDLRNKLSREFATNNPTEYKEIIKHLKNNSEKAIPNDAHIALAEYNIPILTMNIDGLHQKAGSKNVIELHGCLPSDNELDFADKLYGKPVLYGDVAPNYIKAYELIDSMSIKDILLIIGASSYSGIAQELRYMATSFGIQVIEIQDNAASEVRKILQEYMS